MGAVQDGNGKIGEGGMEKNLCCTGPDFAHAGLETLSYKIRIGRGSTLGVPMARIFLAPRGNDHLSR